MGAQHRFGASKGVPTTNNIEALRIARGWSRPELGRRMGTSGQQVERLEKGQRKLSHDWMGKAAEAFGVAVADIITADLVAPAHATRDEEAAEPVDMVGIQHIDMAYGLGATFAVDHPEVEVLQFPKQWIATITHSPPAMLTWTRGKGDSMEPTIRDGDLVLLDRSRTFLDERDAMWAFTIGEEAAIKRLRRQGERCQIFSDNGNVPVDEQNLQDMNIVGRVVFVGSRK